MAGRWDNTNPMDTDEQRQAQLDAVPVMGSGPGPATDFSAVAAQCMSDNDDRQGDTSGALDSEAGFGEYHITSGTAPQWSPEMPGIA
jgi:hypothetical protein